MQIRRLYIHGFKSFAAPAVLYFEQGITAVVGPNGCGKSNVVDAIRWCLGESSAKDLRGTRMSDVIFAGTAKRPPAALAEVSMTFSQAASDASGQQPHETSITRRLLRDGTSQYLLNNSLVRLRDITELFLGTGVGTTPYSIIEQGRITSIVHAKPQERIAFIEEVAGISKYKLRKKMAEKRIVQTHQNIEQIQLLITENERTVKHLQKAAEVAARFMALREELRQLEMHRQALLLLKTLTQLRFIEREQQKIELSTQKNLALEEQLTAQLEALLQKKQCIKAELEPLQDELNRAEKELTRQENSLNHWKEQLLRITEQAQQCSLKQEEMQQTEVDTTKSLDVLDLQLVAEKEELEQKTLIVKQKNQVLEEKKAALKELEAEDRALQKQAFEAQAGYQEAQRREERVRQHLVNTEEQKNKTEQNIAQDRIQQKECVEALDNSRHLLEKQEHEDKEYRSKRDIQIIEMRSYQNSLQKMHMELKALEQSILQRDSRLKSLQTIIQRMDGYGQAVQSLLKPEIKHAIAGLDEVMAAKIVVEPWAERALESYWGDTLQSICVETTSGIVAALDKVQSHQWGRVELFNMATLASAAEQSITLPVLDLNGVAGFLAQAKDVISSEHMGLKCYLQQLLAGVVIVKTREAAQHCLEQYPFVVAITIEGEIWDAKGWTKSAGKHTQNGFLATRREIRELKAQLIDDKVLLEKKQKEKKIDEDKMHKIKASLKEIEHALQANQVKLAITKKDIEHHQKHHSMVQAQIERADARLKDYGDLIKTAYVNLDAAKKDIEHYGQACEHSTTQKENFQHKKAAFFLEWEDLQKSYKILTAEESRLRSEYAVKINDKSHLEKRIQLCKEQRVEYVNTLKKIEQDRIYLQKSIEEAQQMVYVLSEKKKSLQEELQVLKESESALDSQIKNGQSEQQDVQKIISSHQSEFTELRLAHQECSMEQQRLLENTLMRWDLDLRCHLSDYHMKPPLSSQDERRILELEKKIKHLGNVDLQAVDRCEVEKKRLSTLIEQKNDLEKALALLKQAMDALDVESEKKFSQSFTQVSEIFTKLYARIFPGGQAQLQLNKDEETGQLGVEIIANPPGKRPTSIHLLSGGEKALTATALVFSLFLVKPSPFCILDEVDAPLDEANVNRFNGLLLDMAPLSQFIVITHNKNTMATASRLYGVTMEQPGQSKIVHVEIEDKRHTAA